MSVLAACLTGQIRALMFQSHAGKYCRLNRGLGVVDHPAHHSVSLPPGGIVIKQTFAPPP